MSEPLYRNIGTMTTAELVLNYLHTLQDQGVERLPVDESARGILRAWMQAARRGTRAPMVTPPPAAVVMPATAPVKENAPAAPPQPKSMRILSSLGQRTPRPYP